MGRKKKNARSAAHGRKIHVNKYINQRGKTKKREVASCQPAPNRVQLQEMPLTRWPVPKIHDHRFSLRMSIFRRFCFAPLEES